MALGDLFRKLSQISSKGDAGSPTPSNTAVVPIAHVGRNGSPGVFGSSVSASIPSGWLFLKSVQHFVVAFDGEIWPSRLLGYGIGVIIFTLMSWQLFGEQLSPKTLVCLGLSVLIILIQVLWK